MSSRSRSIEKVGVASETPHSRIARKTRHKMEVRIIGVAATPGQSRVIQSRFQLDGIRSSVGIMLGPSDIRQEVYAFASFASG